MNRFFTKCKLFALLGIFQQHDSLCYPHLPDPDNYPAKEQDGALPIYYPIALAVNNRPITFSTGYRLYARVS
jgi:hypothetical protein